MNIAFHINILNSTSWRWISLSILMSKWEYPNGREKKVYSTVFCSKFKTECCRYATKKYWITIIFSDKYCETIIISLKFSSGWYRTMLNFYPPFLCRVLAAILKMADILKILKTQNCSSNGHIQCSIVQVVGWYDLPCAPSKHTSNC